KSHSSFFHIKFLVQCFFSTRCELGQNVYCERKFGLYCIRLSIGLERKVDVMPGSASLSPILIVITNIIGPACGLHENVEVLVCGRHKADNRLPFVEVRVLFEKLDYFCKSLRILLIEFRKCDCSRGHMTRLV